MTGDCFGSDEKDVWDERREKVVSLLVYGLGDVWEVSRVDGRLRRLRDGVAGEEGAEGIMVVVAFVVVDWKNDLGLTTPQIPQLLL